MAKRILIIEDDPCILEILQLIFQEEGYLVFAFLDGKSALSIVHLCPDVISLDVRIAGYEKTGDQICADLKSILPPCSVPVLLLSAEAGLAQLALACKSDDYLAKPFDVGKLIEKVAHLAA